MMSLHPNLRGPTRAPRRGVLRAFRLLPLLIFGVTLLPSPARAYEHDAHYAWTYYVALHMGYTKRQAFQLASGCYALDEDKDTGPMEATAGDALVGATRLGHTRITRIWRDFHAFERTGATPDQVSAAHRQREAELWTLAVEQRNPGPLIHFVQDTFAHHGYDDTRGHAFGGHSIDFMSRDPEGAWAMSATTIVLLAQFRDDVLKQKGPQIPALDRLKEVLSRLVKANPAPNPLSNFNVLPGETLGKIGRPDLRAAVDVINAAVREDEASGLLPRFPTKGQWDTAAWGKGELPYKWMQFDYNENARVKDKSYALEQVELTFSPPNVAMTEKTPDPASGRTLVEVKVNTTCTLSGLAELSTDFLPVELPLVVSLKMPASGRPLVEATLRRLEGPIPLELLGLVDKKALDGTLEWECVVHGWGLEPKVLKIPLKALAPAAAKTGGRLKFEKLSDEDAAKLAGNVLESARLRGGTSTPAAGSNTSGVKTPVSPKPLARPVAIAPWGGAHFDRGRQAMMRKDWRTAETELREAIRLNGSHPLYHYCLCAVMFALDRFPEAEASARKAVELDPGDPRLRKSLAASLLAQKKWSEAEKAYREGMRLAVADGSLRAGLAVALLEQQREPEAVEAAREAIRLGLKSHWIYPRLNLTP